MNVYKLEAAIGLNSTEYQKGLSACGESMAKMGDKIKAGAAAIGKVTAAGLAAGVAGVTALTKSAVEAYADYEQLTGGVEKLFGESSDLLMLYAKDAYKTAGMSVNAYMETVTGFSAALTTAVQAAGGSMDEAVEYADTAMQDMSDNANTFGTDIASIQTAYQGFAKQNYTMLDNLKLGYGGTKAEMERLIEDANKLRRAQGINSDLTIESYADIITAIHDVQTEMNITGTTAREASKTISGSISSAKAAWQNLIIEMGKDDGDINAAFNALGESVGNVADNLLPRIEKTLDGVGDLIVSAAPQITKALNRLLPKILPSLIKSSVSMVGAIGQGIFTAVPDLLVTAKDLIGDAFASFADSDLGPFNWIKEDAIKLVDSFKRIFKSIDFYTLKDSFGRLGGSLNNIFKKVGDALTWTSQNVIEPLVEWAANDILPNFIDSLASAFDLLGSAVDFLREPASVVWNDFLKPLAEGAGEFIAGSLELIAKGLGAIADEVEGVDWDGYWEDIDSGEFFANWKRGFNEIKDLFGENADAIDEFFNASEFGEKWNNVWQNFGESIHDTLVAWTAAWVAMQKVVDDARKAVENFIDTWKSGVETMNDIKGTVGEKVSSTTKNTVGGLALRYLAGKIPGFAGGGRVTEPTLAIVGEKEPETIVPDSKRGQLGNVTYNVTFNVDGYSIKDDASFIEQMSRKLEELRIKQSRAMGGAAW